MSRPLRGARCIRCRAEIPWHEAWCPTRRVPLECAPARRPGRIRRVLGLGAIIGAAVGAALWTGRIHP